MDEAKLNSLIDVLNKVIIKPIIYFVFALAIIYFIWGLVEFLINSDNDTKKKQGKSHMFWGLVGMFIMVSAYGIINLIIGTIKDF